MCRIIREEQVVHVSDLHVRIIVIFYCIGRIHKGTKGVCCERSHNIFEQEGFWNE